MSCVSFAMLNNTAYTPFKILDLVFTVFAGLHQNQIISPSSNLTVTHLSCDSKQSLEGEVILVPEQK